MRAGVLGAGAERRRRLVLGATALVLLVVAVVRWPEQRPVQVVAVFDSAVGVFPGSEVRLMGVPIGTVTSVEPDAGQVRVAMEYDASYDLPADARAVIVSPSIIADRFVQLTPAYDGDGDVLASGDVIGPDRTRTPLELDEMIDQANEVFVAFGPEGANANGALSRALDVAANNLEGNGALLNRTINELGSASETLGGSSEDFFATVENLAGFVGTLARDDTQVRRFHRQLARLSRVLAEERDELSSTLAAMAETFGLVDAFVRKHREQLVTNVDQLASIATTLDKQRNYLDELLALTPVGFNNLMRTWDADNQAVRARPNLDRLFGDAGGLVCDALIRAGIGTRETCRLLLQLGGGG